MVIKTIKKHSIPLTHFKSKNTKSKQSKRQSNSNSKKSKRQTNANSKQIKIISYNISWESMTGKKKEWALCSNNTNKSHPRHYSVCVGNVANVFKNNSADFILLQEAENYKMLIEHVSHLKMMNYEMHESSKDKLITFWNKKYKLARIMQDEFEPGRPWMAILFTNGLCIVNVHFGHYSREQEIIILNQLLKKIKKMLNNEYIELIHKSKDFFYKENIKLTLIS